jgi:hypothetical protein
MQLITSTDSAGSRTLDRTFNFGKNTDMNMYPMLWILWIRMFLGLLDPDPLVKGTEPDPSIIKKPLFQLFCDLGG